jgi:anthranilate phosphoribosyltransferase
MTDAFVHVVVDPGAVARAAAAIDDLDQVGSVHLVTGDHDLVVQLDLDEPGSLPQVVAEEIHGVTGVIDTVTNVAYPA